MLLNAVFLLTIFVPSSFGQYVGSCGSKDAIKYAKATVRPASIINDSMIFPSDEKTADTFCRESKVAISFMRDFGRRCLKEMPKQGNHVAAFGFNKVIRKACKDEQSRKIMYQNLKCFNPVAKDMRKELEKFRKDMVRANFLPDSTNKIIASCCIYFARSSALSQIGRSVCDENKADYLEMFMGGFAGDVLDLICSGMKPESDKCKSLTLPPEKVAKNVPYVESFVPALLQLMSSMSA